MNCSIVLLPAELVRKLCDYLTPDAVCRLEQTCTQLQDSMNQPTIWKKQVESFPVSGIPFGDSSEATYSKLRKRWDYFNWRLLKYFYSEPEWFGWDNPYRVALRTKFTMDKLLGDVQNFVENDLDEALEKLKEEANLNPDRDWNYRYPLKIWQVTVELDHSDSWNHECRDYLLKWMVHGQIIPRRKRIASQLYGDKNVFIIESNVYQDDLMMDESDSENENDSSGDENQDTEDAEEEEEDIEGFDDNSDTDEEEEGPEDLE